MSNETENGEADSEQLQTHGHVERTVLHQMAGNGGEPYAPTTVGSVTDAVASVVERGGYANHGTRSGPNSSLVQQSTLRRTFSQLHEKGLVQRVEEIDPSDLGDSQYDLGELRPDGDPDDPTDYSKASDDARVTDWILTDEGRREVERFDARYADELDDLAARFGRPRGETASRVDV